MSRSATSDGTRRQPAAGSTSRPGWIAAAVAVWLGAAAPARAVIVTGTQGSNTTAPSDPALAERWGQVGLFRPSWGSDGFLGTPISPTMFITAKHIVGSVGDTFTLSGTTYTTVARFNDPASDLAIWQVSGTFPAAAIVPLYDQDDFSPDQPLYVFGVGADRGAEVFADAFGGGTELKGWQWGTYYPANPVQSWGTNTLAGLTDLGAAGIQLTFSFSSGAGANEGTLAYGDSGGPVFMEQDGIWKLAGVNYSVQSSYRLTATGSTFNAAIFDKGGLYTPAAGGTWVYNTPSETPVPALAYSTSTPARLAWINEVITPVPEPGTIALLVTAAAWLPARRRRT